MTQATSGTAFGKNFASGVLEKLFGRRCEPETIREICRDAYYYDPIMGGCADLMCDLPFSDFSLTGLSDQKQLDTYLTSLEKIRIKSLMPVIALDYLVDGAFLGVLSFNDQDNIFTSMIPQDLNDATITHSPVFGHTPLVDINISRETRAFLNNKDPRTEKLLQELPEWLRINATKGGTIKLLPEVTVYIPRRTLSSNPEGVSYFNRCIPIFLAEKALLQGTIEQAYRRQRAILHIAAGDEDWEPNDEELANISNLFQKADMDPIGAAIATRQGIQPSEILAGGQFWRYDESFDSFTNIKMRALGVNDAILSADASWTTLDQSLSIFIQSLRAFRGIITRRLFYEKIFPYIAHQNGYVRPERSYEATGRITQHQDPVGNQYYAGQIVQEPIEALAAYNPEDYFTPVLEWHNKLQPEADETYLGILTGMTERGIPLPMRIYAAAAGQSFDELLQALDQDVEDMRIVSDYKRRIAEFQPQDDQGGGSFAALKELAPGKVRKVGLGNREYQIDDSMTPKGRKVIEEQQNKRAARVLASAARIVNQQTHAENTRRNEQRISSPVYGNL